MEGVMSIEEDLRKNVFDLQRVRGEQKARAFDELHARVLSGRELHPDAPHLDEAIRRKSRAVFAAAKKYLFVESMPWHHKEIWLWAASCEQGHAWVEECVAFWDQEVARQRRLGARLLERLRLMQGFREEDYVYEDGDELL